MSRHCSIRAFARISYSFRDEDVQEARRLPIGFFAMLDHVTRGEDRASVGKEFNRRATPRSSRARPSEPMPCEDVA